MKPKNEKPEETAESDEDEVPGLWLFGMFADMGLLGPEPPSDGYTESEAA